MKKAFILISLVTAMILSSVAFADTSQVKISGEIGLDGKIEREKYVPITMTIENSGDDIKGRLEVLIPQTANQNGIRYLTVYKDVEIPQGTTKIIRMGAFLSPDFLRTSSMIKAELKTNGQVFKGPVSYNDLIDQGRDYVVGILSDNPKALNGINSIQVNTSSNRISAIAVDLSGNFPERVKELDMIDVLVIDDFNTDVFSSKQLETYNKYLESRESFVVSEGDVLNEEELKAFIKKQMNGSYIMSNMGYGGWDYSIRALIGSVPKDKLPPLSLLLTIVISFVFVVGPLNFLVLKRLDKTHLTWYTMTGIVAVYILIIFVVGKSTTLNDRLVNELAVTRIEDNHISRAAYFGVNGSSANTSIAVESEGVFRPIEFNYYRSRNNQDSGVLVEMTEDEMSQITYKKAGAFNFKYSKLNEEEKVNWDIGGFVLDDDKLIGKINLNLGYDLNDVLLLVGNRYKFIGDLEDKEQTIEMSISKGYTRSFGRYNRYDTANIDEKKKRLYNSILAEQSATIDTKSNEVFLIGWSKTSPMGKILVNDNEADRITNSLVMISFDLEFLVDGKFNLPEGLMKPTIVEAANMNYEQHDGSIYFNRTGHVVAELQVIEWSKIESMYISFSNVNESDNLKVELKNVETDEYEEFALSNSYNAKIILDKGDFKKFINGDNKVVMKISADNGRVVMPTYSVKGGIQ